MKHALQTLVLAFAGTLGACGAEVVDEPDTTMPQAEYDAHLARATASVFGDGTSPTDTVGDAFGEAITAGEIAVMLELFPTLTVEQAVEDIVDIRAAHVALIDTPDPTLSRGAASSGRALAWTQAHVWEDPAVSTPDPERVEVLLTDPLHITRYGVPELAVATHVLFVADEDAQTEQRAQNAERLAQRVRDGLADLDRPPYGFDLLRVASEVIPEDDPLLDGMELYSDPTLTYPERFSGNKRWVGLDSVVPGFASATFTAEPNTLVGPARSLYGWHLIVVEEFIPESFVSDEERREIAIDRARQDKRSAFINNFVAQQMRTTPIYAYEDNISLLALSGEDRLRLESESRGDRFQ